MILLFTSARDDRPYHMRDFLNVCCESSEAHIQFGYRKVWVAPNLQSGVRLKGQDALIVFCELTDPQGKVFTYHPIRLAKVIDVRPEHDSLTLDIELGSFFDYEKYASDPAKRVGEFEQYVRSSEEQPTPVDKSHEARFVREDRDWDKGDFTGKWLPLVEYLGRLERLKDCAFLCPMETALSGSSAPLLASTKTMQAGRVQYSVQAGKSYEVAYKLFFGEKASQRPLEVVISEAIASIGGPFLRQWCSGIEASFVLNFRRSFEAETSTLTIRARPPASGRIESPEFQSLVKVNVPWYVLPSAIFLMTAGAFLLSVAPERLGNEGQISSLFWLLKEFAGALSLSLGSYIGFRKLPFKTD